MPTDYLRRLTEICREHGILFVDDEVQSGVGRTGKMWAIEHNEGVAPDLLVSGKSIGGGLPLAAVTGAGLDHGRGSCRRARRNVRRATRSRVPPPSRCSMPSQIPSSSPRRPRSATRCARASSSSLRSTTAIGEVRGLGPMLAFELAEQSPDQAAAIVAAAFERKLLLLACGMYGNVIRLLAPLTIERRRARGRPRAAGGVA